jgi:hypothetical protein
MKVAIDVTTLADEDLVAAVSRLAATERTATVQLLIHLAEMDRRRLYLALGFRSLVAYGIEVLHMSEDAAYNRVQAARAGRRHPEILELIESGLLSVTTARMLNKRLTPQNAPRLIGAAKGKTRAEVEELLAREFPQPDAPSSARKVPQSASLGFAPPVRPATAPPVIEAPTESIPVSLIPPAPAAAAPRRAELTPLSPDRYKITFTASGDLREKLRRAQDLMRHAIPDGDIATIFDRALTLLLEELASTKHAATSRPRSGDSARTDTRHIPADVKRAVWERDDGCCAFVGRSGRRCGSRAWLEYHHLIPYEEGGQATAENIQLRCRAHNQYEAWVYYGAVKELALPAAGPEQRPNASMTHGALTPLSAGP